MYPRQSQFVLFISSKRIHKERSDNREESKIAPPQGF